MSFEKKELRDFIIQCDESILWSPSELEEIYTHLIDISLYNGGRIIREEKVNESEKKEQLMNTLNDGIQKVLNHYAQTIGLEEKEGKYYKETDSFKARFEFLKASEFVDKIDVNSVDKEALTELHGIGNVFAERIIDYREKHGQFVRIYDLLKVKGIGPNNIRNFWYAIKTVSPEGKKIFVSPALLEFKKDPTISNYFDLIKKTGGVFQGVSEKVDLASLKDKLEKEKEYKRIVVNEIGKICEYIKQDSFPKYGRYGTVHQDEIKIRVHMQNRVTELEENAAEDNIKVAMLKDGDYFNFLRNVLGKAKKRIYVVMFYMNYQEDSGGSTKELLDELVSAKKRGVNVKVILDRGERGAEYGSNIINKNAIKFLTEQDIPVLPDERETRTHSKIVLIDDKHSILGSHNWTSSSFFRYEDKSVYVQSEDMCGKLSDYFDELWKNYGKNEDEYGEDTLSVECDK